MTETLSQRERHILELAAKGHTDKGIASELGIAPSTVLTYWLRIRSKLGPHSRAELVAGFVRSIAEVNVAQLKADLETFVERSEMLKRELSVLRQFMDSAPEAMLIIGRDSRIRFGNTEAAELLETPQHQLEGMSTDRFIPENLQHAHRMHHLNYLRDPHRMQMGHASGIPLVTGTGRTSTVIGTLNHAETLNGDAVILILRKLDLPPEGEPISNRG